MDTILAGVPITITQNVVYALPSQSVWLQASVAVETSVQSGSGFAALANSTTGAQTSAGYIRCTTANSVVFVKRVY